MLQEVILLLELPLQRNNILILRLFYWSMIAKDVFQEIFFILIL